MIARKKNVLAFASLLLLLMSIIASIAITSATASSTGKNVRSITEFMEEKQIAYSEAKITDHTLTVKLLSEGKDYCTREDIHSIQKIYAAVEAKTILGEVDNVAIEIYSQNGTKLYAFTANGVSSEIEGLDQVAPSNTKDRTISNNEIVDEVTELVNHYGFALDNIELTDAEELDGTKLVLTVNSDGYGPVFTSLDELFQRISSFSISTSALAQCQIIVNDPSGECLYDASGSFRYGDFIVWIGNDMEDTFIAEHAPPSE